jgi:hypothetical protein
MPDLRRLFHRSVLTASANPSWSAQGDCNCTPMEVKYTETGSKWSSGNQRMAPATHQSVKIEPGRLRSGSATISY